MECWQAGFVDRVSVCVMLNPKYVVPWQDACLPFLLWLAASSCLFQGSTVLLIILVLAVHRLAAKLRMLLVVYCVL